VSVMLNRPGPRFTALRTARLILRAGERRLSQRLSTRSAAALQAALRARIRALLVLAAKKQCEPAGCPSASAATTVARRVIAVIGFLTARGLASPLVASNF
jgi:hypothetical protein